MSQASPNKKIAELIRILLVNPASAYDITSAVVQPDRTVGCVLGSQSGHYADRLLDFGIGEKGTDMTGRLRMNIDNDGRRVRDFSWIIFDSRPITSNGRAGETMRRKDTLCYGLGFCCGNEGTDPSCRKIAAGARHDNVKIFHWGNPVVRPSCLPGKIQA